MTHVEAAEPSGRGSAAAGPGLAIGPLLLQLQLDEALARLSEGRFADVGGAHPGVSQHHLRLRAGVPGAGLPHSFAGERPLVGGGCELRRLSGSSTEGVCSPRLAALLRALRFASQPPLLRLGWLLLHASSVRLGSAVHVFVAASGTGKSTLARRLASAGGELLGDEVALVGPGEVAVHPGQLRHGSPGERHPLRALHLLEQGEPSLTRLRPAAAAAALLEAAMVYEEGEDAAQRAFACASELAQRFPVFRTRVPDDARAVALLDDEEWARA